MQAGLLMFLIIERHTSPVQNKEPTLHPVPLGALEERDVWGEVVLVGINTSYL